MVAGLSPGSNSSDDPGSADGRSAVPLVVAVICVAAAAFRGAGPIANPSVLTHIATGRLGFVPTEDPFSSFSGEPWVVQSWGASVLYGFLEAHFGLWAIRGLHGFLAAVVVYLLWMLVKPEGRTERVAIFGLAFLAINPFLMTRPATAALALFAAAMWALRERRLWMIVALGVVWTAVHGSWPLASGILWALAVSSALSGSWRSARSAGQAALSASVLQVVALLAGPLGKRGVLFPFELIFSSRVESVVEWSSIWALLRISFVPAVLVTAFYFAALVIGVKFRPIMRLELALIAGGLVFASVLSIRHAPLAIIAVAALFGYSGRNTKAELGVHGHSGRIVAAFAVFAGLFTLGSEPDVSFGALPEQVITELGGCDGLAGFAYQDAVGNYITFRCGASVPGGVWMDDRFDFYPEERLSEHFNLASATDWGAVEGFLSATDVRGAIVVARADVPESIVVLHEADGWVAVTLPE